MSDKKRAIFKVKNANFSKILSAAIQVNDRLKLLIFV
jgi:hypothetical protein